MAIENNQSPSLSALGEENPLLGDAVLRTEQTRRQKVAQQNFKKDDDGLTIGEIAEDMGVTRS